MIYKTVPRAMVCYTLSGLQFAFQQPAYGLDLEWAKQCSWDPNQNVCVRGSSDPNYSCDVEAEDQDISDDVPSVYIILGTNCNHVLLVEKHLNLTFHGT